MSEANKKLAHQLNERKEKGLLRSLSYLDLPYDFCSNDYLGFARSEELQQSIEVEFKKQIHKNGAGGSRLLSGNHSITEETEQFIADFHQSESGLIFNSGYDANLGLLSAIAKRGDTLITDELIHASLIDGTRLSHAERLKFKHNNLTDLEAKLKIAKGLVYVVVESIYSMDGDSAPLLEIAQLCKSYHANLIVDEAHATGIFGKNGQGLVQQLNLQNDVFARTVTFGKALGIHGAIVLGSKTLRNYLINFSRSFIYTTAAPMHNIIAVKCAYLRLAQGDYQKQITKKIQLYNREIKEIQHPTILSESAIQTILFQNNEATKQAAKNLQQQGFDVKAILSPTVPEGKERLRICLHIYNSDEEIKNLVNHLKTLS